MLWLHASKGKSQNLKKQTKTTIKAPGGQLFWDVTGLFPVTIGGSKFNANIID